MRHPSGTLPKLDTVGFSAEGKEFQECKEDARCVSITFMRCSSMWHTDTVTLLSGVKEIPNPDVSLYYSLVYFRIFDYISSWDTDSHI
jgi:hypothetical protein